MSEFDLEAIRARDARIAGIVGDEYQSQSELDRRALLKAYDALANSLHALLAAAGKVTCRRCDDSGFEPWSDFGGAVIEPCPDCADLRKLMEGK